MIRLRALVLVLVLPIVSQTLAAQSAPTAARIRTVTVVPLPMPEGATTPGLFTGSPDAMAFVDLRDTSLYRGDAQGKWSKQWKKAGAGPGEVRMFGGLHFAGNGTLWINDRGTSRVSGRAADMTVISEMTTAVSLGRLAPVGNGFIAIPRDPRKMALVLNNDAKLVSEIALPPDIAALNPMTQEHYLNRINDSLVVIQFRWFNRLIALASDGRVRYDSLTPTEPPNILQRKFDGGVAHYVDPKARPYAVASASRGDTLLILLGSPEDDMSGRNIKRVFAPTGRTIDILKLPVAATEIAATRAGVFAIGESDDGYTLYRLSWK